MLRCWPNGDEHTPKSQSLVTTKSQIASLSSSEPTQDAKALGTYCIIYSTSMWADVGACHQLAFPCNTNMRQHWCTQGWLFSACRKWMDIWRLLYWVGHTYAWMEEKLTQNQTLWLDQLTDMLNKTTCHTGHLTVSLQVHITWGGDHGSSLRSIWTIHRAGSSLLILVKVAGGP